MIECYPMAGTPVAGSFSLSGISLKGHNEVTLLFGYEDTPVTEKTIVIDADKQASDEVNLERLWAQQKIANLGLQYKANAEEIETMGKKYGIVTDNTSLIVLETVNDYIQYDIVPPAELRPEFDRWAKQQIASAEARKFSNWENVATYYQSLLNWWNKDIKYPPKPVEQDFGSSTVYGVVSDRTGPLPGANVVVRGTTRATQTDFDGKYHIKVKKGESLVFSFTGFQNQTVRIGDAMRYNVTLRDSDVRLEEVVVEGYRNEDREEADEQKVERKTMSFSTTRSETVTSNGTFSNGASGSKDKIIIRGVASLQGRVEGLNIVAPNNSIVQADTVSYQWSNGQNKTKVNQWNPDRMYLKALAAAPADKKYGLYLDLREGQETNPGFYFDVANYFYNNGNKTVALLVLSNIADLSLENHQLYKSLTYVLRQWEAYDDALYTANQVAKWRAQEPQAHRDLALTLEDNQQYQAAFDELIKALNVKNFGEMQGQYEGVEDIILMDINRMLSEHKGIDSAKLDKKYTEKMPVTLRIILNWNQMDTDIDLHVVEPTGEECYYGHRDTDAGARFSKDFTQGYGPEQYLLRNPLKGKFIIKTNYFGERALTENGPATVMVEIYTTKNGVTQRTLQTIQLGQIKENQNLAEVTLE